MLLTLLKVVLMLALVEATIRLLSRYAKPEHRPWMLVAVLSIGSFGLALF